MHAPDGGAGWERLFWLVFSHSSNPIVLLDERRRVIELNEPALRLFGRAREDLIGMSIEDSIQPSERARARAEWQQFLRTGEYSGRRVLIRPDASEVEVDFAARLAKVSGKAVAIYVILMRGGSTLTPRPKLASELPLTHREREVVTLIALGNDTASIAKELHISPETVRTHVRNAMAKLSVHTRAQLVAVALCNDTVVHDSRLPG
jgi:PAS domain S-box-containing protein